MATPTMTRAAPARTIRRSTCRIQAIGGTLLGQCLYGALHGWHCRSGDFAATVRLLLGAGERVDPTDVPTGRDDVDAVLREQLAHGERFGDRGSGIR